MDNYKLRKIRIEFDAQYWSRELRKEMMKYIIHNCRISDFPLKGKIIENDKKEYNITWDKYE